MSEKSRIIKKENWQKELFKYSFMKKEKVSLIKKHIKPLNKDFIVFDIGCAQGTVSYFLREALGGRWSSFDVDYKNVKTALGILKKNVFLINDKLPLKDESGDIVFSLDYIEHIEDDVSVIKEIKRVLKSGGMAVVSTPTSKKFMLINKLKKIFGMTPDIYGHKREGYDPKELNRMFEREGFETVYTTTYSKFFTELIEFTLNLIFVKFFKKKKFNELRDGSISPKSEKEFRGNKFYYLYKIIYPVLRGLSFIDKLLFFKTGYAILSIYRKT